MPADALAWLPAVSIDLAVWEGARPDSEKDALKMYASLYELYIDTVRALTAQWFGPVS